MRAPGDLAESEVGQQAQWSFMGVKGSNIDPDSWRA